MQKTYYEALTLVKMGRKTEALERVRDGLETTNLPGMQYEVGKEELKLLQQQLDAKKHARVISPIQLQTDDMQGSIGSASTSSTGNPQGHSFPENKRRTLRIFKKRLTSGSSKQRTSK